MPSSLILKILKRLLLYWDIYFIRPRLYLDRGYHLVGTEVQYKRPSFHLFRFYVWCLQSSRSYFQLVYFQYFQKYQDTTGTKLLLKLILSIAGKFIKSVLWTRKIVFLVIITYYLQLNSSFLFLEWCQLVHFVTGEIYFYPFR